MKKALPILFVVSTAFITAASLTVATNGSYTQLKAADNSVNHTITFTKDNITSNSFSGSTGTFAISQTTSSGSEFGCTGTIHGDDIIFKSFNMFSVEDDYGDGSLSMTFEFHNVLSAVSVTLNGDFDDGWKDTYTFTNSSAIAGGFKIPVNINDQTDFSLDSIVVQYTCSY